MTPAAIPILASIAELSPTFDAWIVDIWGVMHNGARAFDAAGEACRAFRAGGGIVMLLSNAPRPFSAVVAQMAALGVDPAAYDGGVTSGDATRGLIEAWAGRPLLHIGPERDKGLFAGLDVTLVPAEAAEAIVCSGFWDDTRETPADYAALFERLAARRLPMICANPDIVVERGDKLVYCAGALAAEYAEKGGEVVYAGKPLPADLRANLRRHRPHRGQARAERAHPRHRRRRRHGPARRAPRRPALGVHRQRRASAGRPRRAGAGRAVRDAPLPPHRRPAGAGVAAAAPVIPAGAQ